MLRPYWLCLLGQRLCNDYPGNACTRSNDLSTTLFTLLSSPHCLWELHDICIVISVFVAIVLILLHPVLVLSQWCRGWELVHGKQGTDYSGGTLPPVAMAQIVERTTSRRFWSWARPAEAVSGCSSWINASSRSLSWRSYCKLWPRCSARAAWE